MKTLELTAKVTSLFSTLPGIQQLEKVADEISRQAGSEELSFLLLICGVNNGLQKFCVEQARRTYTGKIPQDVTHTLADFWGRCLASQTLLTQLMESEATGTQQAARRETVRKSSRQQLLALHGFLSSLGASAPSAGIVDWLSAREKKSVPAGSQGAVLEHINASM